MVNTPTIREYLINPDKLSEIRQAIEEGVTQYGMQTFDQALMNLFQNGIITEGAALEASTNPGEFKLHLKGIESTSDRRWQAVERGNLEHNTKPTKSDLIDGKFFD